MSNFLIAEFFSIHRKIFAIKPEHALCIGYPTESRIVSHIWGAGNHKISDY